MKYTVRAGRKQIEIEDTWLDRAINRIDPVRGARRLKARMNMALSGMYFGASTSRRALSEWNPKDADPDSTLQYDLSTLRDRSRDMIRNIPLATGAINTVCTNVIGTGLTLQSRLDRSILDMTDDQAAVWERKTETEWSLFWDTNDVDASRTLNGHAITELAFRQSLENGEAFINLPRIRRPGAPYDLKIQIIEADRICNKDNTGDTPNLFMGVEKDSYGAPTAYHICNQFQYRTIPTDSLAWQIIPAYSAKTGLKNIIHLYKQLRPGQTRGIPYLTPVVESLKQAGRYSEAELMAAVISSMFTVFIETESGESYLPTDTDLGAETGASASDKDVKLAAGAIIDLAKGEKIAIADPKRPNTAFDPFIQAILRQIGVALELPFEVLVKHFTSSYTAARAALLEAWKFFNSRRVWLATNMLQVIYEVWLYEAIATGRISAPGYFANPLIRRAYATADWVGPSPGHVDPVKEISAAEKRIGLNLTTRAQETAAIGGDWDANISQIRKERQQMIDAGINPDGNQKNSPQTDASDRNKAAGAQPDDRNSIDDDDEQGDDDLENN